MSDLKDQTCVFACFDPFTTVHQGYTAKIWILPCMFVWFLVKTNYYTAFEWDELHYFSDKTLGNHFSQCMMFLFFFEDPLNLTIK